MTAAETPHVVKCEFDSPVQPVQPNSQILQLARALVGRSAVPASGRIWRAGHESGRKYCPRCLNTVRALSRETRAGAAVAVRSRGVAGELLPALDAAGAPTEFPMAEWPGMAVSVVA